jgi:hypothetical protein
MSSYTLGTLTLAQLEGLVEIQDRGVAPGIWEDRELGALPERELSWLADLRERLVSYKTSLVNEATLWARAIYPLLVLAERDNIKAFSAVPLSTTLGRGELRGEVDGAMAWMGIEGDAQSPYLVVVEAKRGVEGHDPVAQLLGGLLCAARKNHQSRSRGEHVLYGVYTIADLWTFVKVTFTDLDGDRPVMTTVFSREYMEKTEAARILLLLRSMVGELLPRG